MSLQALPVERRCDLCARHSCSGRREGTAFREASPEARHTKPCKGAVAWWTTALIPVLTPTVVMGRWCWGAQRRSRLVLALSRIPLKQQLRHSPCHKLFLQTQQLPQVMPACRLAKVNLSSLHCMLWKAQACLLQLLRDPRSHRSLERASSALHS